MKILNSRQIKEIDRKAIQDIGIIGPILMENAGLQITRVIQEKFPEILKDRILIIAGKGNNGGDGFVVARHLFNQGCQVEVILLAQQKELRGDTALNAGIATRMGVPIQEITTKNLWTAAKKKLKEATIIVDAIFGTGLTQPAGGIFTGVIKDINRAQAFKVAVDIPSGLSSDTFQIIGPCVKADLTVCLAAPKIAHVFPPAEEYIGDLIVAGIGVPPFLFEDPDLRLEMVEKKLLWPHFQKRKRDTHKGSFGHLLIISGSMGKTGAAVMAAKAALKMGAGLVTVGTPKSCLPMVARSMDELMTEPLPETPEGTLSLDARDRILELLKGKDAFLVGPGISTHESTASLLTSLLPQVQMPLVLDADALNILALQPELMKSLRAPAVLTPHPGEFGRLLNLSPKEILAQRLDLVSQFSQEKNIYLVLKGYRTLISDPEGYVFVNPTGNPGMASGGTGDVLSGMIASQIMQQKDFLKAVMGAVYVHGLSGDIASAKIGEKALTAGNIISHLPAALKEMNPPVS